MICRFALLLALVAEGAFAHCHYTTWAWDTKTKKSVNHQTVSREDGELSSDERGQIPECRVCREDQQEIKIAGLMPFAICRRFAADLTKIFETLKTSAFVLKKVEGYRVGKSKGPLDSQGLRTQFSNHSFGTAVDINSQANGLYDQCPFFEVHCHLLRGGPWIPSPMQITKDSLPYRLFTALGWKWGGDLKGQQKDFMHFSLTGD